MPNAGGVKKRKAASNEKAPNSTKKPKGTGTRAAAKTNSKPAQAPKATRGRKPRGGKGILDEPLDSEEEDNGEEDSEKEEDGTQAGVADIE